MLGFGSSTNLAAAYGVAITTTMLITTILFYRVARRRWHWPVALAMPIALFFIAVDLAFFGANMLKIFARRLVPAARLSRDSVPHAHLAERPQSFRDADQGNDASRLTSFISDCGTQRFQRVPGTAVFMSGNSMGTPLALLHNLKHNKVLHQQVVVLTVLTEETPYVSEPADRVEVEKLPHDFWRVKLHFGFMEKPDVPAALAEIKDPLLQFPPMKTTYFIGRETVLSTRRPDLSRWRGALFAWMTRNAGDVTSYFGLPPNGVVELGARVEV